jgi:hypothetical protein
MHPRSKSAQHMFWVYPYPSQLSLYQVRRVGTRRLAVVGLHALQKDHYGRIGLVFGLAGMPIVVVAALASAVARVVILDRGATLSYLSSISRVLAYCWV